jgi:hypothetical protein
MFRILVLLTGLTITALGPTHARAGQVCKRDDPTPRPLPATLVPEVEKVFGLQTVDPAWVERSTVVRCMDGKLWACNAGANLPCGKGNTTLTMAAGDDWCRQNPNADFIPAYITGHDNVRRWRCTNGAPAITGKPALLDAQGYLSDYWKVLE